MPGNTILAALMSTVLLPPVAQQAGGPNGIPANTVLNFQLLTRISTKSNHVGDTFNGKIDQPISSGKVDILPVGSVIKGHVAKIQRAGRQSAALGLVVDTITTSTGAVYIIPVGAQRLIRVRTTNGVTAEAAVGGASRRTEPPPPANYLYVTHKNIVLRPGTELRFLISEAVAVAKTPTEESRTPRQ